MLDLKTLHPFLDPEHLVWAEAVERFSRDLLADVVPPVDDEAARVQAREILSVLGHGGWLKPIERGDLRHPAGPAGNES